MYSQRQYGLTAAEIENVPTGEQELSRKSHASSPRAQDRAPPLVWQWHHIKGGLCGGGDLDAAQGSRIEDHPCRAVSVSSSSSCSQPALSFPSTSPPPSRHPILDARVPAVPTILLNRSQRVAGQLQYVVMPLQASGPAPSLYARAIVHQTTGQILLWSVPSRGQIQLPGCYSARHGCGALG
ncbi:hypothetical protein BJY00DRAFT_192670 [Aspergillus carlsbadensis]|nr:hypothetical protein BJY00DRAFT_192670 [Aspergillus carlsbadensis]